MKRLQPAENLTEKQVEKGLKLVVVDGMAAEAMSVFTGGTFLIAMALQMGASNAQIGLIVALPALTNIFQLISVWLVQKYNNRRAITVFCSLLARFPLVGIGLLPFVFSGSTSLGILISILSFHYFFGSVSGASWNAWMKDLIPTEKLGSYYAHRIRLTQLLNVVLSLALALALDYVKKHYPMSEMLVYGIMFIAGGVTGLVGVYLLSITPEPKGTIRNAKLGNLFLNPLRNPNFRKLLTFQSLWVFAINIATPFFSVYMLKALHLSLFYVISLGILSQVAGIIALRFWGKLSDKYSNKTLIRVCAPAYICCMIAWVFTSLNTNPAYITALLIIINICSGICLSGINLSLTNIGYKIAPDNESIVYISLLNTITSCFSSLAPIAGGLLADYFVSHQLLAGIIPFGKINLPVHKLLMLNWSFFFVIGAMLATASLFILKRVNEAGEKPHTEFYAAVRITMLDKRDKIRLVHAELLNKMNIFKLRK